MKVIIIEIYPWWKWNQCSHQVLPLWHYLACSIQCKLNHWSSNSPLIILFWDFSFEGRVVAKLPFEPIPWIRGLSHRNLSGEDFTDCSFIFLYVLCTMSIRQVWTESEKITSIILLLFLECSKTLWSYVLSFAFDSNEFFLLLLVAPSRAASKASGGFFSPPGQMSPR